MSNLRKTTIGLLISTAVLTFGCKQTLTGIKLKKQYSSDPPAIFWNSPNLPVLESSGIQNDLIQLKLNYPSNQTIRIEYRIEMGSTSTEDHNLRAGTREIVFTPGETITTIPFTVFNDQISEPIEGFTITLGIPNFGRVIGNEMTTISILEDPNDYPTIHWRGNLHDFPEEPEGVRHPVLLSLDRPSSSPVTVDLVIGACEISNCNTAVNNEDFKIHYENRQIAPSEIHKITFAPFEIIKTIEFESIYSFRVEGTEGVTISLSNPENARLPIAMEAQKTTVTIDDNNNTVLPHVRFQYARRAVPEGAATNVRLIASIAPSIVTGPIRARIHVVPRVTQNGQIVCQTSSNDPGEVTHTPPVQNGTNYFDVRINIGQTRSEPIRIQSTQDEVFERAHGPRSQPEREDYCFELVSILDENATINAALSHMRFETFDNEPIPKIKIVADQYSNTNFVNVNGDFHVVNEYWLSNNLNEKFPIHVEWDGVSDLTNPTYWCEAQFVDVSSELESTLTRATPQLEYRVNPIIGFPLRTAIPNQPNPVNQEAHVEVFDDNCRDERVWEYLKVRLRVFQNPNRPEFQYCQVSTEASETDISIQIIDDEWPFWNAQRCNQP